VVLKGSTGGATELAAIKGRRVNLVELSVSHYLLARALDSVGLSERDITVVNTGDADIVAAAAAPGVQAVVTWNPQLSAVKALPDWHEVFDSSDIPGEIIDLMVVNTQVLADNPALGKALTGAWYETLALMAADTPASKAAREAMATASGTDLAGFESQLATTRMFYAPEDAAAFARDPALRRTMDKVRTFSFAHGLLGEGAKSADAVGIGFADGGTLGDAGNVKLRFTDAWMQQAADGQL
jgi:NitT/TauT family transport system substrate-binding protein